MKTLYLLPDRFIQPAEDPEQDEVSYGVFLPVREKVENAKYLAVYVNGIRLFKDEFYISSNGGYSFILYIPLLKNFSSPLSAKIVIDYSENLHMNLEA